MPIERFWTHSIRVKYYTNLPYKTEDERAERLDEVAILRNDLIEAIHQFGCTLPKGWRIDIREDI
jgi:hypothetical protein